MASDSRRNGREHGPGSFVHLDVVSAYSSRLASPSTPQEYVSALDRQFKLYERTPVDERRPAISSCSRVFCTTGTMSAPS
jgi:hypothetical protein